MTSSVVHEQNTEVNFTVIGDGGSTCSEFPSIEYTPPSSFDSLMGEIGEISKLTSLLVTYLEPYIKNIPLHEPNNPQARSTQLEMYRSIAKSKAALLEEQIQFFHDIFPLVSSINEQLETLCLQDFTEPERAKKFLQNLEQTLHFYGQILALGTSLYFRIVTSIESTKDVQNRARTQAPALGLDPDSAARDINTSCVIFMQVLPRLIKLDMMVNPSKNELLHRTVTTLEKCGQIIKQNLQLQSLSVYSIKLQIFTQYLDHNKRNKKRIKNLNYERSSEQEILQIGKSLGLTDTPINILANTNKTAEINLDLAEYEIALEKVSALIHLLDVLKPANKQFPIYRKSLQLKEKELKALIEMEKVYARALHYYKNKKFYIDADKKSDENQRRILNIKKARAAYRLSASENLTSINHVELPRYAWTIITHPKGSYWKTRISEMPDTISTVAEALHCTDKSQRVLITKSLCEKFSTDDYERLIEIFREKTFPHLSSIQGILQTVINWFTSDSKDLFYEVVSAKLTRNIDSLERDIEAIKRPGFFNTTSEVVSPRCQERVRLLRASLQTELDSKQSALTAAQAKPFQDRLTALQDALLVKLLPKQAAVPHGQSQTAVLVAR